MRFRANAWDGLFERSESQRCVPGTTIAPHVVDVGWRSRIAWEMARARRVVTIYPGRIADVRRSVLRVSEQRRSDLRPRSRPDIRLTNSRHALPRGRCLPGLRRRSAPALERHAVPLLRAKRHPGHDDASDWLGRGRPIRTDSRRYRRA